MTKHTRYYYETTYEEPSCYIITECLYLSLWTYSRPYDMSKKHLFEIGSTAFFHL